MWGKLLHGPLRILTRDLITVATLLVFIFLSKSDLSKPVHKEGRKMICGGDSRHDMLTFLFRARSRDYRLLCCEQLRSFAK